MKADILMNKIIDINTAGNLLQLKLGNNGSQWGDDWDDIPYESNAGEVYDEYVQDTIDAIYDIDYLVLPYAEYHRLTNSDKAMIDFVNRKVPYYYVVKKDAPFIIADQIYLGDTIDEHPLIKII